MKEGISIFYLNSEKPYELFKQASSDPYYVDKSMLLAGISEKSVCISRPRGFGKTTNALMVACYFSNAFDSSGLFRNLKIYRSAHHVDHQNRRTVIFIPFGELPPKCATYKTYINSIRRNLISDLHEAYPSVECAGDEPSEVLTAIYQSTGERFMFVLDDWDFIFRPESSFRSKVASDEDKYDYLTFLHILLDGQYVLMAYMTGIYPLPLKLWSYAPDMFKEYTVASKEFKQFFGFNGTEVQSLLKRYNAQFKEGEKRNIHYEDLRFWYSYGYLCNPYSTIRALRTNKLDFYWLGAAPKNEMLNILKQSRDECGRELAVLISRGYYQQDSCFSVFLPFENFTNKDNGLSLLATLGYFIVYEKGEFFIHCHFHVPNHEIQSNIKAIIDTEETYSNIRELSHAFPKLRDAILSFNKAEVAS
ncbi:MAG: AAA family ATPase, partial [Clostridiales bacterium]|nr:AAA family ATPase [Clostridiales bacterium]